MFSSTLRATSWGAASRRCCWAARASRRAASSSTRSRSCGPGGGRRGGVGEPIPERLQHALGRGQPVEVGPEPPDGGVEVLGEVDVLPVLEEQRDLHAAGGQERQDRLLVAEGARPLLLAERAAG